MHSSDGQYPQGQVPGSNNPDAYVTEPLNGNLRQLNIQSSSNVLVLNSAEASREYDRNSSVEGVHQHRFLVHEEELKDGDISDRERNPIPSDREQLSHRTPYQREPPPLDSANDYGAGEV